MADFKLFDAEYRMMDILWENEPMLTTELVRLCAERFRWAQTTTYTQIKRMIDRGFLKSEKRVLTALVKRDQVEQYDSEEIVGQRFGGSLPKFVTAFIGSKKLTREELDELRRILDDHAGE